MGVVYKAQDTTLDRFVALKFLPEHVSASADDTARFIQEAQAAAALNHPNICTIYGIEQAENKNFIVMEFVEGQTLQKKKSSLSTKQAIDVGIQVAEGLAAAHEKGIVHRDIKPENIMIRKDEIVQIMDFGLAKLRGASRLTKEGTTVGTVGYMSPEQVQGQDLDHRTDIFSLGVVLYELFAGEPPFKGVHETAINYETVNVDPPPVSSLKPEFKPDLDAIVLECLRKEKKERFQSAAEVARQLRRFRKETSKRSIAQTYASRGKPGSLDEQTAEGSGSLTNVSWGQKFKKGRLPWMVLAGFFFVIALWFALFNSGKRGEQRVLKATILPPANAEFLTLGGGQFALSPDGRRLVFAATDSTGKWMLYIRSLDSFQAHPLAGTEGAWYPFWSPDSRFIGFFAQQEGKLKKIDANGGPPQILCDSPMGRGGSWNEDGTIVFSPATNTAIWRVSASGGTPVRVTRLDAKRHEVNERYPFFLPDGKHFLYSARAQSKDQPNEETICVSSLDSTEEPKIILRASGSAAYANGYLLFVRDQTLMAQAFDANRLQVSGDEFPVAEDVGYDKTLNRSVFSVSKNGLVAFEKGTPSTESQLVWFDRSGKSVGVLDNTIQAYFDPCLSPDGKKVAVEIFDPQSSNEDIWIYDIVRKMWTRLTFDPATDWEPVWSANGTRIFFVSDRRNGKSGIYETDVNGQGGNQLLFAPDEDVIATSCSPDGKYLAYFSGDSATKLDLWILPLATTKTPSNAKPFPFLRTQFNEAWPSFSPDGKWIAYESDESGSFEVYVRPFPGPGPEVRISANGGLRPQWRKDGKELYYETKDNTLMAVEVKASRTEFNTGLVRSLFHEQYGLFGDIGAAADGRRFIVRLTMEVKTASPPIRLAENWNSEIEKK